MMIGVGCVDHEEWKLYVSDQNKKIEKHKKELKFVGENMKWGKVFLTTFPMKYSRITVAKK